MKKLKAIVSEIEKVLLVGSQAAVLAFGCINPHAMPAKYVGAYTLVANGILVFHRWVKTAVAATPAIEAGLGIAVGQVERPESATKADPVPA